MTEQQFNDHWDQILKLLADLCQDIYILIVVTSRKDLSMDHKKCLKDFFPGLDSFKGRSKLLFLLSFIFFLSRKIENE